MLQPPVTRTTTAEPAEGRPSAARTLSGGSQAKASQVTLVGTGSLGRPLAAALGQSGFDCFCLVDPKTYAPHNIGAQCREREVHRRKVDVVAGELALGGARSATYARDVYDVPDGIIGRGGVLISCTDNWRAAIGANRLASRMRGRLLKVNVEPRLQCVTVRAYDFRKASGPCAECQFSTRHYIGQHHPHSCDAPAERSTGASRDFADAAAHDVLPAALDMLAGGAAADRWVGSEWQKYLATGREIWSRLDANPGCRWDHTRHWPDLTWLSEQPRDLTLNQLVSASNIEAEERCELSFGQRIALRGRCATCLREFPTARWVNDVRALLSECPGCGRPLRVAPFWLRRHVPLAALARVRHWLLASWGVEPGAVIQIATPTQAHSYVIGGPFAATRRSSWRWEP